MSAGVLNLSDATVHLLIPPQAVDEHEWLQCVHGGGALYQKGRGFFDSFEALRSELTAQEKARQSRSGLHCDVRMIFASLTVTFDHMVGGQHVVNAVSEFTRQLEEPERLCVVRFRCCLVYSMSGAP